MVDLFSSDKDYGDRYKNDLLSQYNLFMNMLDNLTSRRNSANNFFLSVNTGLLALLGALISFNFSLPFISNGWIGAGAVAGIIVAYTWVRTITSYKQLSTIKWKLVWEIEKKLPMRIHEHEWELLGKGEVPSKYRQLTDVEKVIPVIFIVIYILLGTIVIISNETQIYVGFVKISSYVCLPMSHSDSRLVPIDFLLIGYIVQIMGGGLCPF